MRVGGSPAESRKMLRAGNNIAFRKLLDDRGRETRHFDWIRCQTSFSDDRSRQAKIHNGSQIEIETGGLQLCGYDPRAKPQLGHTGASKLRHRRNRSENLFEPVDAAAFMIDGEERGKGGHFAEPRRQLVDLVEAFDISLKKQETARTDPLEQGERLAIRFVSLEPKHEKLANFFLRAETVRVLHEIECGLGKFGKREKSGPDPNFLGLQK